MERRRARAREAADGGVDLPIVLARGSGSNLFDVDGNRYVDLAAGFGAAILGHGPSPAHEAAKAQIDVLAQGLGDLYASDKKVELLERLAGLLPSGGARAILCQSGADAVTAAIKTAALATSKPGVLAFEGAYHGLSYAPLAACGFKPSFAEPFAEQLNPHVAFAPYPRTANDVPAALEAARVALATGTVGAVLVEPVLGRGGVVPAPPGFLRSLGALARESGALVIADEIWTGMGRSGHLLASFEHGLEAEIVCIGKGLGGSFPISACLATDAVMNAWARGGDVIHTSTHAGAPVGVAAALAVLDELQASSLAQRAARLGAALVERLAAALEGLATVRGKGLLVGVDTGSGARGLQTCKRLLERGWIVTAGGRGAEVVVLTPALTIDEAVLFEVVPALREVLCEVAA